MLQVINDPPAFLRNVHAVLRRDGVFAIEQVNYWGALSGGTPLRGFDRLVNNAKIALARRSKNVRRFDENDVAALCHDTGFGVIDTKTYDRTFVVIARARAT